MVVAPYWHPIRVAGEAALFDVFSDGRLELGLDRGAFQYEFDRMAGAIDQHEGGRYLREMLPVLRGLWQGDIEHHGDIWRFPHATSVPKPLQAPHPPIWVAARDPDTFAWAVASGANIMATPLSRPHSEVNTLGQRFADTLAKFPGVAAPAFSDAASNLRLPARGRLGCPGAGLDRARPAVREPVPEYRGGEQPGFRNPRPGIRSRTAMPTRRRRSGTAWSSAHRSR